MARELMLLVATAIVCVAPGIHGLHHLAFAGVGVQVGEITRTGCGETKLCVETPADCDPKDPGCLFTSIVHNTSTSPATLTVELCGESTGYIALGLVGDVVDPEPTNFVCAQNNAQNGAFFFRTQIKKSDNQLVPEAEPMTEVTEIRGSVDGDMIKCEFNIPVMEDKLHVILGSGTADAVTLGIINIKTKSGVKTLTDPTSA